MRKLLIIGAFFAAAACQPMPSADPAQGAAVGSLNSAECAARGGAIQLVGRAQTPQCVIAYTDAGKRCTTGSDCQGDCRVESAPFPQAGVAAVGQCQADSRPFGCHARVEDGKATPAICID